MEELRKKAKKYGIDSNGVIKKDLKKFVEKHETQMKKNLEKYEKKSQLGLKGKEGKTFLVVDKFGYEYAMKTFRANKSSSAIESEVEFQRSCSDAGISPKIIDVDTKNKFIVMEKMDLHLLDEINATKGVLSESRQKELVKIFKTLDKLNILHGDVNLLNYMIRNNKLYIIDFGLAKKLTPEFKKRLGGVENANMTLSLLGFILKLKDANVSTSSYSHLRIYIPEDKRTQFSI